MSQRFAVYVFHAVYFAPAGDTVVSAAPLEIVISTYGGGGLKGEGRFGGGLRWCGRLDR
jgi:hypothetical protein